MSDFEPRIIAFLCNWCSSTAADLAGTARIQYPPNVRIIRLMCSGQLDPIYVAKAILEGADGVLIGGCHPGDCHYESGNISARRKFILLRELLDFMGVDGRRFQVSWVSASEGPKFQEVITKFVEELKELGPQDRIKRRDIIE